jgi:chitinase
MRNSSRVPFRAAIGLGLAGLLTAGGVGLTLAPSASATSQVPEIAPYLETSGTHTGNLQTAITHHGLRSFTAAFVLGNGCTPTWDDGTPLATATAENALVAAAKSKGATPIISFGGQAGTELATDCTALSKLVAAYTSVINRFKIAKIDFDIEGASSINNATVNGRRFTAIKTLEKKFPKLEVSLTLPVATTGLLSNPTYGNTIALLKQAKKVGVRVDVINLMTMNYGGAISDMGSAATTAASRSLTQIKAIWPKDTYKNIGITPMIGQNDVAGEVFSWTDSQTVLAFAQAHGVRRLAFWALGRDQSCGAGDTAPGTCTGEVQQPLDYTDGFLNATPQA